MKHSPLCLDPQHNELRSILSAMGILGSSSYCLKEKRKGGIRQLHQAHTYLLHQQDRQDLGTAGLEPRNELVLLYAVSYNYFSSLPPLFL